MFKGFNWKHGTTAGIAGILIVLHALQKYGAVGNTLPWHLNMSVLAIMIMLLGWYSEKLGGGDGKS